MAHSGYSAATGIGRIRPSGFIVRRWAARIALFVCVLPLGFCAETGEQEMDLLFQTDVVNRGQAKEMLRMGVRINVNVCPTNTVAGYYAIQATIPEELNYPHYDGALVSNCSLLLAVAPCLAANVNQAILINYYRGLIQVCGLKQVGY
ncbi:MAG: hypothetical protein RIF32_24385 [Leptospirales bacterium]